MKSDRLKAGFTRTNFNGNLRGFTLIEMAVAVGISLVIIGGVLSNYNNYNDTQKVKQAAQTLKNNLRFAQGLAFAGKKPTSGCTELEGYRVTFASTSYSVQAFCNDQGLAGEATATQLPTDVTFSPVPGTATFGVLGKGLVGDAAMTITLAGNAKTYSIQISLAGDINDLGFQ